MVGKVGGGAEMVWQDPETRFGGPRGNKPGRPLGAVIGKHQLAKLKREKQIEALVQARKPIFEGNPLAFWDQLFRDETQPIGIRMTAADKLAKLSEQITEPSKQFEALIAEAHASVPPPPKEHAARPDPFVEEMLSLSYERFAIVMREYSRVERQLRLCGDTARADELNRKREDAIAGWNRAAEQERAKLVPDSPET